MTPAARIAATVELLATLYEGWQSAKRLPADVVIDRYFKARRFIGSKDRGAIAELTYWCVRHKATLDWWASTCNMRSNFMGSPDDVKWYARTQVIAALLFRKDYNANQLAGFFDGGKYAPPLLSEKEWKFVHRIAKEEMLHSTMPTHVRLNYPDWLQQELLQTFDTPVQLEQEMAAMNEQAFTDLRTNTLKISRDELIEKLRAEGFDCDATPTSPVGIRLKKREAIFASPLFKQGCFEMQDEGSQVAAYMVQAEPGNRVIDFCAGAGGKTLALAAQMENKGRILAWDTSPKRLSQLPLRLKRAGVDNVQVHAISSEQDAFLKRHKASADRVLVDAPCSGTGTWRRNPDLKWRFTPQDLEEVRDVQKRILESASRLVKVGGRLIYATCSLLKSENEQQILNFLREKNNFRVVCARKVWNKTSTSDSDEVSYLWLTPHQDGVDGFFAAVLERTA